VPTLLEAAPLYVSAADLKDGRAFRFPPSTDSAGGDQVRITCSPENPADAFATVCNRNQQFRFPFPGALL